MLKYDFNLIKGWTEKQIKNKDYHDYSNTFFNKKGYRQKKIAGGHIKYSHWVWNACYGYIPDVLNEIHHVDLDKTNDDIENFWLVSRSEHAAIHSKLLKGKTYDDIFGKVRSKKIRENISSKTKVGMSKITHPNLGKHLPDEVKKKISDANKGKNLGPDNHMYGKQHTEEAKNKISLSNKGNDAWNKGLIYSIDKPEAIESMKEAWIRRKQRGDKGTWSGKHHSEETKNKISEINTKHEIEDVWISNDGTLKYKDETGKNRRLPKNIDSLSDVVKENISVVYDKSIT